MNTMPTKELPDAIPASSLAISHLLVVARGAGGGIVGGLVGYLIFTWLSKYNLDGLAIPGALLGLGAGLAARGQSHLLGISCGIAAALLSVFSEWSAFPFIKDGSLSFFLAHIHHLAPPKLVMFALGTGLAYWFGKGR
jgi:hypothetical protein